MEGNQRFKSKLGCKMKIKLSSFISSFFIILFSGLTPAKADETRTLCYEDQDYLPYLAGNSDKPVLPNPGVLVELTKMAFEKVGLSVNYIRRPWKRCMRMVQDNKVDGLFGVIYVPEREKIGNFPKKNGKIDVNRRLMKVDYPLFINKSNPVGWNGKQFSDKQVKIGTPLGYATVNSLRTEQGIEPNVSFLPDMGLKLVEQGKLDGYIVEKNVGLSILKKQNMQNSVIVHNPPFKSHNLYLFLSHGFYHQHKKDAEAIWSHLATLRKTVLDGMMKKYLNTK